MRSAVSSSSSSGSLSVLEWVDPKNYQMADLVKIRYASSEHCNVTWKFLVMVVYPIETPSHDIWEGE